MRDLKNNKADEYRVTSKSEDGLWDFGKLSHNGKEYDVEAKVYDNPSKYGIRGGRVSKLWVKAKDERYPIVHYERGWAGEKTDRKALNKILKHYK